MSMQFVAPAVRASCLAPMQLRTGREISRTHILNQIIAGIMWLSLDLPTDVSREELEALAHRLIALIRAGPRGSSIKTEFQILYVETFNRSTDASRIQCLIQRAESIVRRT